MPTTTYQFVSFVLFWVLSVPFLFVRPEKFHLPFLVTSIYCGLGMLCMMIWSLSVAKGVGPLWMTGQNIPETSSWNLHWLEMKGINQIIGGIAAGTTNGSDFSRHARSSESYIVGTVLSAWITGVLVSLVGLVVTAACQKIYGEVYWNPPDLLMRMMDSGEALRKGRIQLSHLYRTRDTAYWYTKGVNWRAIPAWICVWAPTIGGLLVTVGGMSDPLRSLVKLYYMAFLVGFFVSGTVFYLLNLVFPYPGLGEYEKVDVYETFTPCEAASLGVVPVGEPEVLDGVEFGPGDDKTEHGSIVEKSVRDAEIPCRRWNLV
jgi:cytosine/uracil/thiamine/allantoin permease